MNSQNLVLYIIENTDEAKAGVKHWGMSEEVLTRNQLKALRQGKCLVVDVEEYVTFITLEGAIPARDAPRRE